MKLFKKALAIALSVLVFAGVYAGGALAAPEDGAAAPVAIQLNGKNIEFPSGVEPYYDRENWRVFVPVRDTFTALGAVVSYDDDTRVITFTRGDVTVVFPRDSTTLEVTAAGVTTTIESDVKPISIDNRVLVPVKFVAQALGCNVGWDSAERTAIIIDPVTYLAGLEEDTYEIVNTPMEIDDEFTGNFALDANINVSGDGIAVSAKLGGVVSVAPQMVADMKIDGTLTSDDAEALEPFSEDGEVKVDGDIIYNYETGLIAIKSELLNSQLFADAIEGDVWLTMDMFELAAQQGIDIQAMLDTALAAQSTEETTDMKTALDSSILQAISSFVPTSVDDFQILDTGIGFALKLFGDSGFTETDGVYVNEVSLSEGDETATAKLSIVTADGKATSFSVDMEGTSDGMSLKFTMSFSAAEYNISVELKDTTGMDVKFDISITPTDDKPRASLPEGATSVDILTILEAVA